MTEFLRTPYYAIHDRFGKAGVIVAIVALIAALGGTALAASGLSSKQKKEVTAIAKKYAGKNGTDGTNGTNGTNGATGPEGKQGPQGLSGTNGKGVLVGAAGAECGAPGGSTVEVEGSPATKKAICNGAKGEEGEKGEKGDRGEKGEAGACSNANPDCTLPTGASLRGSWGTESSTQYEAQNGEDFSAPSVSFVLPLKTAPIPAFIRKGVLEGSMNGNFEEGSRIISGLQLISGYATLGATVSGPGIAPGTVVTGCETTGDIHGTNCGNTSCGFGGCGDVPNLYLSKPTEATESEVTLTFGLPEGCTASYQYEEGEAPRFLPQTLAAAPGYLCLHASAEENVETEIGGSPLPLFTAPSSISPHYFHVDPEGYGLVDFASCPKNEYPTERCHYRIEGSWVVTGD